MMQFCTYFDKNYLHRGLALYFSIKKQLSDFKLWVLCMDDATLKSLTGLGLDNIRPIALDEFESKNSSLLRVKNTRSLVEYYWTCTPFLPRFILHEEPTIKTITYLDADMFFFGPPEVIEEELSTGSILIVPHDYSEEYQSETHSGKYNVGILTFQSDENALACLDWWADRCAEWCYARHEEGKFGDQRYLDNWPIIFKGVKIADKAALGLAPWNIGKYGAFVGPDGTLYTNGGKIICYHFHAVKFCTQRLSLVAGWNISMTRDVKKLIYMPYIESINQVEALLTSKGVHIKLTRSGFPFRYVFGRMVRGQPLRHFCLH
jgi:hypothetical protein